MLGVSSFSLNAFNVVLVGNRQLDAFYVLIAFYSLLFNSISLFEDLTYKLYPPPSIMQNDQNEVVDLYVPRKWLVHQKNAASCIYPNSFSSSSSRIISATDHGAIQIDFVDVDPETGRMIPGKVTRYAICGALRAMVRLIANSIAKSWFL